MQLMSFAMGSVFPDILFALFFFFNPYSIQEKKILQSQYNL